MPHPLVLYNIGLVHAAARHPVEAVAAFDRLLADPGVLRQREIDRARAERDEQAALIGEIAVAVNVPGAQIEVDNVAVATSPLSEPIRVGSGEHLVSAVAKGHYPERQRVVLAGKRRIDVRFELRELSVNLARLAVKTNVPAAEILVDGASVGKTPLPATLAFAPGPHTIEARRPGYVRTAKAVTLGEGTSGSVRFDLTVDAARLKTDGGLLGLSVSEPDAVVFVDGVPRGSYARPLALPAGEHVLRVERAEFFPFEREIDVPRGGRLEVPIDLQPTPKKRADYRSSAIAQRTWGTVSLVAGAAIAAGSAGFLVYNQAKKNDAQRDFDNADLNTPGGECYPGAGGKAPVSTNACLAELDIRLQALEDARSRDKFGWLGVGVGAAALGTGLALLLTSSDPDRYEPKAESDVFAKARVLPLAWLSPVGSGLGLAGSF